MSLTSRPNWPRPDPALRLEHLADLLPGGIHELLLLVLDDPRAEAGGDAEARVEVQPVDPVVVRRDRRCRRAPSSTRFVQRVPRAVERRRDDRDRDRRRAGSRPAG